MRTFRHQIQPPPIVSGYRIDDVHRLSVVVPEATTNLVTNPSFEMNTTNWSAVGSASIARSTTRQRHGAYSLAITMSSATGDGAAYGTATALSLTSGQPYAASVDVYAPAGMPLKIYVATTGGVQVGGAKQFKGIGRWQRIVVIYNETSTTGRRVYLTKDASAMTGTVYIDGLQAENKAYDTTYCDGSLSGLVPNQSPPAYYWIGTPHASMSARSGLTRSGGRVMSLNRYGFLLLAIIGLGLVTPNVVAMDYAQIDGGQYQRTQKQPRTFQIGGRFDAHTPTHLDVLRGGLARVLDRDVNGLDQPLVLRYQQMDCDRPIGEELAIPCVYAGGLEGTINSHVTESVTMSFTTYLPAISASGTEGASLTVQQSVTDADYALLRTANGAWSAMGSGLNDEALAITYGNDQYAYVGGAYGSAGGVANTEAIARYALDTGTWSAMGAGGPAGAIVYDTARAPNGDIYVVGDFGSMGGAATSQRAARWNIATETWTGLNYPGASPIRTIIVGPNGTIYTGSTDGTTRSWDGSSWTTLGTATGGSTDILDLAIGLDGHLYVAGSYTSPNGVLSATNISRYTIAATAPAWGALTGGDPGGTLISGITFGLDGTLFAALGTSPYFSSWNGMAWTSISGLNGLAAGAATLPNGMIAIYGLFTTINGVTAADSIALYNGSILLPLDANLPGTPGTTIINVLRARIDGTYIIGGSFTGTATTAANTTVTNSGTAYAYPSIVIQGPASGTSRIYQIVNYTTGKTLYVNYTVSAGETLTFRLVPDNLSFTSDFQGDIADAILPGSNEADFFLQPGANTISFFAASSTVTAALYWTPGYAHVSDTAYR